MFSVYAIYNAQNDRIYIGQCLNLDERLRLHNGHEFKQSYTSRYDGNWKLIHKEVVSNRKDTLIREKQLKSYRGRQFVKSFIPR